MSQSSRKTNFAALRDLFDDALKIVQADAWPASARPEVGDFVPGEGIYLGEWEPRVKGIAHVFNVYAAPENLPQYRGTADHNSTTYNVADLENWHGYDGEPSPPNTMIRDDVLLKSLQKGSYRGGWIVPPSSILSADSDVFDVYVWGARKNNLLASADIGAFKGTYPAGVYWSSSPLSHQHPDKIVTVKMPLESDFSLRWAHINEQGYCRPVRLVRARRRRLPGC